MSYLFHLVTHDLTIVRYLADRVSAKYLARLVEIGRAENAFGGPHYPDAEALFSAAPNPGAAKASSSSTCQLDRTVTVTE